MADESGRLPPDVDAMRGDVRLGSLKPDIMVRGRDRQCCEMMA